MSKNTFPQALHGFYKSNGVDAGFATEGPSLTRQEFAEECDINTLMKRYDGHVIGGPGNMSPANMMYADFTQVPGTLMEYHEFMQMAEAEFMRLPAVVRKEFENDPQQFVEFASDPENLPQMVTWGLADPKKVEQKAPVEPPGAPPASPGKPGDGSAPPAK